MQILANEKSCIGAGQCVFAAPDIFDQDDNGTVIVLQPNPPTEAEQAKAKEAVNICPSRSLTLSASPAG